RTLATLPTGDRETLPAPVVLDRAHGQATSHSPADSSSTAPQDLHPAMANVKQKGDTSLPQRPPRRTQATPLKKVDPIAEWRSTHQIPALGPATLLPAEPCQEARGSCSTPAALKS